MNNVIETNKKLIRISIHEIKIQMCELVEIGASVITNVRARNDNLKSKLVDI
jgi:hypothetical protein